MNIFFFKKIKKLLLYLNYNYIIILKLKKIPLSNLFYNILKKELIAFKKQLLKNL